MPAEPTVGLMVRVDVEMANALDKHCADETMATGNPVTRSDVMRLALSQYLGLTKPRNGDRQPPADR